MCIIIMCNIELINKIVIMLSSKRLPQFVVRFVKESWPLRKVDPTCA